jgi:hypothetical protein
MLLCNAIVEKIHARNPLYLDELVVVMNSSDAVVCGTESPDVRRLNGLDRRLTKSCMLGICAEGDLTLLFLKCEFTP